MHERDPMDVLAHRPVEHAQVVGEGVSPLNRKSERRLSRTDHAQVVCANLFKNPNYALEPEWYRSADITVVANWALWDRGQALKRGSAMAASIAQLRSQRELLTEMMSVEIESAASSFEEALAERDVAATGLEASEEAYRLEQERFQNGVANNTRLLAAHPARSGAKLLQAETKLRISHAALRKALGVDPEENP